MIHPITKEIELFPYITGINSVISLSKYGGYEIYSEMLTMVKWEMFTFIRNDIENDS